MAVLIIHIEVQPGVECTKVTYPMKSAYITQGKVTPNKSCTSFDPGDQFGDLRPVIRTDCRCSVKCAEGEGN